MKFEQINKIFLFGGGEVLARTALDLKKNGKDVLVITSTRHFEESTFSNFIKQNKIPHLISIDINTDQKVLSSISDQTLGISFGAAWIFKNPLINLFSGKLINCHGTRLPQDKGGGFISWNILRGEKLGYCVFHQITEGIDDGPIVFLKEFTYPDSCRVPNDYFQYYNQQCIAFVSDFLKRVENKENFSLLNQPQYLSTYWPRLSTENHGFINWNWSLQEIERFICAFDEPFKGASSFLNGKRIYLKSVFTTSSDGVFHPYQSGIIYRKSMDTIFIATKEGGLCVRRMTLESGENAFTLLKVGDRLLTPAKFLEEALSFRAVYTPTGLKENSQHHPFLASN